MRVWDFREQGNYIRMVVLDIGEGDNGLFGGVVVIIINGGILVSD